MPRPLCISATCAAATGQLAADLNVHAMGPQASVDSRHRLTNEHALLHFRADGASAAMMESTEPAVLAAEKRRCDAMLANDAEQLDAVLDRRLVFNHSSGVADDKVGYIEKIASGRIRYSEISWNGERIIPLAPDAALMTGRMTTAVQVEGSDKLLENRVLAAWSRTEGRWQLVAFQSTPLKA
jgi:hypothetical protein